MVADVKLLYTASGHILIREAFEDTMLQLPKPDGEEGETVTIPVPKGTQVCVSWTLISFVKMYDDSGAHYYSSF